MLKEYYEKDLNQLSAIRSQRTVILNTKYKILHDQNMRNYFSLIPKYVFHPDELTWNEKYDFEKNTSFVLRVINSLFYTMIDIDEYNSKDAKELTIKCRSFPDSGGLELMYLFSHIPIIQLIDSELMYIQASKTGSDNGLDPNKVFFSSRTMNEDQEARLFEKDSFAYHGDFPDKNKFISNDLIYKHAKIRKEEYENGKKEEIRSSLELIVSQFSNLEKNDLFDFKVSIGSTYWDQKVKRNKEKKDEFTTIFKNMVHALANKNKQNIEE